MKIVYKKYDEEYKRLACHLSIDPLADGGGQQVLSPYHAMGCNPAMMIDPLGLQGQTGMSSPNGNNHFVAPLGFMVEGTYVYLSADRLGTGKSIGMKRLEPYIYNSMMEMAEAQQQKIIDIRFAAVLDMINGYNTALQSLVSSYDIRGMINSQMKPGYLDGGKGGDGNFEHVVNKTGDFIAITALRYMGSTDWSFANSKDNFNENTNKCNKFVYDVLNELSNAIVNLRPSLPNGLFGGSPITAGQWADPNYHIPNWQIVTSPQRGDIVGVSANFRNATGHVGIMISPTQSIGASTQTIRISEFGYSVEMLKMYPGNNGYVYRRWSPGK